MSEEVLIVRSLRELDAVVAEKLFDYQWWKSERTGVYWFMATDEYMPQEWQLQKSGAPVEGERIAEAYNPDCCPRYAAWCGLEPVIHNREGAGYGWKLEREEDRDVYWAILHRGGIERFQSDGYTAPVAFCLAALASTGCLVRLEQL